MLYYTTQAMAEQKQTTVLVGGCFDILHQGHIIFLEKAKKLGDKLIVLLESDGKVKKLKGDDRPIHSQKDRAKLLSTLKSVDQVICLPFLKDHSEYDNLIANIKPDIIAITKGDPNIHHKKRAAKLVKAQLKEVMDRLKDYSTTKIISNN